MNTSESLSLVMHRGQYFTSLVADLGCYLLGPCKRTILISYHLHSPPTFSTSILETIVRVRFCLASRYLVVLDCFLKRGWQSLDFLAHSLDLLLPNKLLVVLLSQLILILLKERL